MSATIQRVYAAMRIDAGLYLQPSNDGTWRYVIASYEDGRAYGLESGPERFDAWAWGPIAEHELLRIQRLADIDASDAMYELRGFAMNHSDGYRTKREAVEAALRHGDALSQEQESGA